MKWYCASYYPHKARKKEGDYAYQSWIRAECRGEAYRYVKLRNLGETFRDKENYSRNAELTSPPFPRPSHILMMVAKMLSSRWDEHRLACVLVPYRLFSIVFGTGMFLYRPVLERLCQSFLHGLTFLSYLVVARNPKMAPKLLCDVGIFHEAIHAITLWIPTEGNYAAHNSQNRNRTLLSLALDIRKLEQSIPGFY